jgi:SAM-dependent methyltransferase
VLELGPGGTLATGAYMLLEGAKSYCAVDAFPLATSIDQDFYRNIIGDRPDLLRAIEAKDRPPFRYVVDRGFRIDEAVGGERFDRIVSCAAFEHFDDPADTIARMTKVARPGAAACLRIDMSTHSGVLRQRDPNNIYRYPDWMYWLLPFPGKPNRYRAKDYVRMLEQNGWKDIEVVSARATDEDYVRRSSLARPFRDADSQMHILSAVILARLAA